MLTIDNSKIPHRNGPISIGWQSGFYSRWENRPRGSSSTHSSLAWNRNPTLHRRRPPQRLLDQMPWLIREEENIRRLNLENQGFRERISEVVTPASARFIARFRHDQLSNPTACDAAVAHEEIVCTVFLEPIQFNQPYATWPCLSQPPHRFHSRCMLELLRMKNTCPLYRHPVETSVFPFPYLLLPIFFPRHV